MQRIYQATCAGCQPAVASQGHPQHVPAGGAWQHGQDGACLTQHGPGQGTEHGQDDACLTQHGPGQGTEHGHIGQDSTKV